MKFLSHLTVVFFVLISTSFFAQKKAPKLMVGIVVDQMCYEYLYRYYDQFSDSGFVKLMQQGTNCKNTHYNYVPTYTGPGHASIYTGTTPTNHGIIANQWFVKETGKSINCVEDKSAKTVGSTSTNGQCSPQNLLVNTITDQLKMTYANSKVISVSIKDRGAILPGGHLSDGTYWYDKSEGKMITSDYFKSSLPSWVNQFNSQNLPDQLMKSDWTMLKSIENYNASGPDNSPYEHLLAGKSTPTFPYNFSNEKKKYSLFTYLPAANSYLKEFAIKAIESEKLGQDEVTDFLAISFSSTDILGHAFGPQSVEVEDMYLRLDLEIAALLSYLESKIGKDSFTLFLTADHAVLPVPQLLIDKKLPGGYLPLSTPMMNLNDKLSSKFGAKFIQSYQNNNIYLDDATLKLLNVSKDSVQEYIRKEIEQWEGVKKVYLSNEIEEQTFPSKWSTMIQNGWLKERNGDLFIMLEPGYLSIDEDIEKDKLGTSHGSAFNYDTHVPLLWYGKNIPSKEIYDNLEIIDITATLAFLLDVSLPNATTGKPILGILK
jgi:predicted AlkP superfamily pyrophosphatase or phosphodiesterase